ncbi:MAG: TonB-dependent receptor [Acidobacteria bacterium]|nr:TonB-dependent receptor [Acidobacteriota bacterium]
MLISDSFVNEVQLVTNGFAAEFGNTPGLIMNVVTPSGTNILRGSVSYRFRRPSFYSRPFFYPASKDLPENKTDNFTATVGAPIIKDRWHFHFGYEYIKRDDKAVAARLLTIRETDKAQLIAAGLPASIFPPAIPSLETGPFYIFRTDVQLNKSNRLTARFNHSDQSLENFIPGGLNTLERATDTTSVDYSLGVQLASYTPKVLNELRFQYAQRETRGKRNELSGTGPSIVITGVANFGSPGNADTINPLEKTTQIQDNLTWTSGTHAVKFGGGFNFIDDLKRSAVFARYTFPSIAAYLAARNGTDLRSYTDYVEAFGDPEITYKSTFWNFFVQDDWKITRRLKFKYGVRYDLYRVPPADSTSPFAASRRFKVDKNNFAPRLGIVYSLREGKHPTIIRAGAGIYYEVPWLNMYERALLKNGNPEFFNFSFPPTSTAPAFPGTLGSLPAGSVLPPQDIDTIGPDLENMYAIHSNIQLEHAITNDLSFAGGYTHSAGRHIAVYRNINLIPFSFLADGRPVFGRLVNPSSRFDARFNNIFLAEAAGVSEYNALTLQLTKRLSRGLQFSVNYTLSKATDDAPEQNLSTGAFQNLILSDPYNRQLDKGYSFADQRHTFAMSLVAQPRSTFQNKFLRYLFNNNQVGIIATANSGETFNVVSSSDINNDGVTGLDRPVGIKRNSGTTPKQFNVDLRYSRFFKFTERYKLEVFGEFGNLFNINSIVQFTDVTVTTNANGNGELVGGLPDFKARNQSTSQDSRQFQLGFKFVF